MQKFAIAKIRDVIDRIFLNNIFLFC